MSLTAKQIRSGRKPCPVCKQLKKKLQEYNRELDLCEKRSQEWWQYFGRCDAIKIEIATCACSKTDHPGEVKLSWEDGIEYLEANGYPCYRLKYSIEAKMQLARQVAGGER